MRRREIPIFCSRRPPGDAGQRDVRVHGAERADARGLVTRHAGAEQTGDCDGRDDADDRDDDQQLD